MFHLHCAIQILHVASQVDAPKHDFPLLSVLPKLDMGFDTTSRQAPGRSPGYGDDAISTVMGAPILDFQEGSRSSGNSGNSGYDHIDELAAVP